MSKLYLMLADVEVSDVLDAQKQFANSRSHDTLIIFGALALAVALGVWWAIRFSLKKKKRKHLKHRHHRDEAIQKTTSASKPNSRKKRRRTGRPHRPMNPTLAQTGGLPPLRGKDTPLPPMP